MLCKPAGVLEGYGKCVDKSYFESSLTHFHVLPCEILKLIVVLIFMVQSIMGTTGIVGRTGKKYSTAEGLLICDYMEQLEVKHSLHSPSDQDGLQPKFTHHFFYYKAKLSVLHSKQAEGFTDGSE